MYLKDYRLDSKGIFIIYFVKLIKKKISRENPNNNELVLETRWICDKMKQYSEKWVTNQNFSKKVLKVIENIRVYKFEVMFIYFYRRNEFMKELSLSDLWKIYELDAEWAQFYSLKYSFLNFKRLLKKYFLNFQVATSR